LLILGLDVATCTGWALYEPGASLSSIKTGLLKASGEDAEEKAASLACLLLRLLKADRPDFVAIEQPMRNVVSFRKTRETLAGPIEEQTINPNALHLSSLTGAAVAVVACFRLPWQTIPSATWRAHFLGFGRKPGFDRSAWKRAAVERCRMLRIDVKNADAAEAVGIAFAGAQAQKFKMMVRAAA
jgi:Holliday junction resolvasome RuvABC endonuclease subunit